MILAALFALAAVGFAALYVTTLSDLNSTKNELAATKGEIAKIRAAEDARPNIFSIIDNEIGDVVGVSIEGDESYASLTIPDWTGATPALYPALADLGFPSSIGARIGNTRALDGTLTADGDHCRATWTYHPDDGLKMVIERTD